MRIVLRNASVSAWVLGALLAGASATVAAASPVPTHSPVAAASDVGAEQRPAVRASQDQVTVRDREIRNGTRVSVYGAGCMGDAAPADLSVRISRGPERRTATIDPCADLTASRRGSRWRLGLSSNGATPSFTLTTSDRKRGTRRFSYEVRLDGAVVAEGMITVERSGGEDATIWEGEDDFINYCINENHRISSSGGRLYCVQYAGNPTVTTVTTVRVAAHASARSRWVRFNEALSPYLSEMIDRPAAVRDGYWIARTDLAVRRAAIGASERCLRQVRLIRRAVARTKLGAAAKRKRILDALAPTYYRC